MATNDLFSLIREMRDDGDFEQMLQNPMIQFGDPQQGLFYLGATLLPEVLKPKNKYNEMEVHFEALIADDSTPYSRPQAKQAGRTIHMDVELGSIDAQRDMMAEKIDKLNEILSLQGRTAARAAVLNIIRTMTVKAIADKKELKRWQTLRDGAGKYISTNNVTKKQANYNPPADLRFQAGVDISDDAVDPVEAVILEGISKLKKYGFETDMIVCRSSVLNSMEQNQSSKDRAATLTISSSLQLAYNRILNPDSYLNPYLGRNRIAPITTYDGYYRDTQGQKFYLEEDEIYFIARTDRDFPFLTPDSDRLLNFNSLGYYGIGTCQNQTSPGDVLKVNVYDDGKPDYFSAMIDSRSLPVVQNPEAICVISNLYNV